MRAACVVGVVVAWAGCAQEVRWGAETAAVETKSETGPAVPAEPKKMTAVEFAATFKSARDCVGEAARLYTGDATRGFALLVACVGRGDFTDLPQLVDGPWREELLRDERGHGLLADVVARRGGSVEVDVAASQERRFPMFTLEEAFEDPGSIKGKLVLVRGVAKKKPRREKSGKLRQEVKELVVDGDAPERGAFESGRTLQLTITDVELAPKVGTPHVMLVRFESVTDDDAPPLEPIDGEDDDALAPPAQSTTARAVLLAVRVPDSKR